MYFMITFIKFNIKYLPYTSSGLYKHLVDCVQFFLFFSLFVDLVMYYCIAALVIVSALATSVHGTGLP